MKKIIVIFATILLTLSAISYGMEPAPREAFITQESLSRSTSPSYPIDPMLLSHHEIESSNYDNNSSTPSTSSLSRSSSNNSLHDFSLDPSFNLTSVADSNYNSGTSLQILRPETPIAQSISNTVYDPKTKTIAPIVFPNKSFTVTPHPLAETQLPENSTNMSYNRNGIKFPNESAIRIIHNVTTSDAAPNEQLPTIHSIADDQQSVIEEITSTLKRQNVSKPKSTQEIVNITADTTMNYLRGQNTTDLVDMLYNAPTKATDQTPITRFRVWSAITANISDSLGLTKASKFISAQITKISNAASQALTTILGDPTTTDGVKQTRVQQLVANVTVSLQNLAATMRALPTQVSDVVSGSTTTVTRDAQGNIATKSVVKDDSNVHYTYTKGKISGKVVDHYVQDPTDPTNEIAQSQDVYQYDAQGKISAKIVSHYEQDKDDPNSQILESQDIYKYDAQGNVASIATTYKPGNLSVGTKEIQYFANNKVIATVTMIPMNEKSMNISYESKGFNTIYSLDVPQGIKNVEPVISPKTGKFLQWRSLKLS